MEFEISDGPDHLAVDEDSHATNGHTGVRRPSLYANDDPDLRDRALHIPEEGD